jgi:hypothetical protein
MTPRDEPSSLQHRSLLSSKNQADRTVECGRIGEHVALGA